MPLSSDVTENSVEWSGTIIMTFLNFCFSILYYILSGLDKINASVLGWKLMDWDIYEKDCT
jgi:hypothetical protein